MNKWMILFTLFALVAGTFALSSGCANPATDYDAACCCKSCADCAKDCKACCGSDCKSCCKGQSCAKTCRGKCTICKNCSGA